MTDSECPDSSGWLKELRARDLVPALCLDQFATVWAEVLRGLRTLALLWLVELWCRNVIGPWRPPSHGETHRWSWLVGVLMVQRLRWAVSLCWEWMQSPRLILMVDYNDYDKTIFKSMSVLSVALKLSNFLYQKPNPTFYNIVITIYHFVSIE